MVKTNAELREKRKQWFCDMEQKLHESWSSKEDSLFYYHSSEDRIVLSHALFWTITQLQFFKGKMRKEKLPTVTTFSPRDSLSKLSSPLSLPKEFFLLLRQNEEEMLDAFLLDDDYFSELLHSQDLRNERSKIASCNIQYELLPTILGASHLRTEKDARILAAISLVAAGYAGDMDEELVNELLDDMDYHFNKVKCRKIEMMMPRLMEMAESEMEGMR